MTTRIRDFLRSRREDGPCLVVDLDLVRDNYNAFAKALPDTRVYYAVKANPAPEVLALLARLGSCFDTASVAEIEMALAAGATAYRISYGNTIKKARDIARAYALGVADERYHDGDAAEEEDALHDVLAIDSQIQIAGNRPAAGKRGAEHFRADQDRRADHGQHVLPQDSAIAAAGGLTVHGHGSY